MKSHRFPCEDSRDQAVSCGSAGSPGALVTWLVDRLPEAYRLPLWLHCAEGLSIGDVAIVLSLSERKVRARIVRGIAVLQDHLLQIGLRLPRGSLLGGLSAAAPAECAPTRLVARIGGLVREAGRAAA